MSRYWLSFDLGIRGNYDALYEWLDNMGAEECADSLASFTSDKRREEIASEVASILDPSARVYLIGKRARDGRVVGNFVMGKRRRSAWAGYGGAVPSEVEEEA